MSRYLSRKNKRTYGILDILSIPDIAQQNDQQSQNDQQNSIE